MRSVQAKRRAEATKVRCTTTCQGTVCPDTAGVPISIKVFSRWIEEMPMSAVASFTLKMVDVDPWAMISLRYRRA
jgi:hypothetical protein